MANIVNMRSRDYWDDHETLKKFFADQLYTGRLTLCLGAGVSKGMGLPDWNELMNQLVPSTSSTKPPNELTPENKAEWILNNIYAANDFKFAQAVKSSLYNSYNADFSELAKNRLLQSIGAISMASSRGSASNIITFNFDDLLENYLQFWGMDVSQIDMMPAWNSNTDIKVFHPHGLLKLNDNYVGPNGIVFAQSSYSRIVGKSENFWHSEITSILRKHICIFIGLSGADYNLMSMVQKVNDSHASKDEKTLFWGIRFCTKDDPYIAAWEKNNIYQVIVENWDEVPSWLFKICQLASKRRKKQFESI